MTWIILAAAVLLLILFLVSKRPRLGTRTVGDVLKHGSTMVTDPTNLTAVNADVTRTPTLNFALNEALLHTTGSSVSAGAIAGTVLQPRGRFTFRGDGLLLRVQSGSSNTIMYLGDGPFFAHTIVDPAVDAYDLGVGDDDGYVVILAQTYTKRGEPPKRRMYRVSVQEIKGKLGADRH